MMHILTIGDAVGETHSLGIWRFASLTNFENYYCREIYNLSEVTLDFQINLFMTISMTNH
jgi:hypothetical protein